MSYWPTKAIGEFCIELNTRKGIRDLPVYSVSKNLGILPQADRFKKRVASLDTSRYKIMEPGDFAYDPMLLWSGSIARNLTGQTGVVSPAYTVFRPVRDVNPQYFLYFLRQPERLQFFESISFGTNERRRKAHFHDFAKLEIPVPPRPDQERIVALLDEADALRKLRTQADQRTADLIPALFHDMFGDPATNPMGWSTSRLGDALTKIESGWSPNCLSRPAEADEWGVLKLSAATWGEYDSSQNKALELDTSPRTELEVKQGDLLFTRKNTFALVGSSAYVFETRPRLLLPDLIFRLHVSPDSEIAPLFLWGLLSSPTMRARIRSLASGSASSMPNISQQRLKELPIVAPPLKIQLRFNRQVEAIRSCLPKPTGSSDSLTQLFNSILSNAFSTGI